MSKGRDASLDGRAGAWPSCKVHQFRCQSGECLPNTWVCDGAKDCEDGSDELTCLNYLDQFQTRPNSSLERHDVEKWMHTSVETCARHCAEAKTFTCMSFNYKSVPSK